MIKKYQGQFGVPFSKISKDKELSYIVPPRYRTILGIVGPKYSGKTTFSSYLVEDLGYRFYSLSRIVREEAEKRGLSLTNRLVLQDLGDMLRKQYGNDYLTKRTMQRIYRDLVERNETGGYIVIDGIKNMGEISCLRKLDNFYLIGISASVKIRHERAQLGGHFNGPLDLFIKEIDERDFQTSDEFGQQVNQCLEQVQYKIENEGNTQEFLIRCRDLLIKIPDFSV